MSVAEAALMLGVSPITVRRRIATGELQAVRVGQRGAVRIPESALARLLRPYQHEQGAA
jgi:excisionase family DNA binding protein